MKKDLFLILCFILCASVFAQSKSAQKHFDSGQAYAKKGNYDKAIKLYPDFRQAYVNRGSVYARKRNYELAITDYTSAIKMEPNDATVYISPLIHMITTGITTMLLLITTEPLNWILQNA